jgi:hypothetical protein
VSEFGFAVVKIERPSYEDDPDYPTGWSVRLPHQCNYWEIVGEADHPATQDDAAAGLEQFIAEAQQALARLRAGSADEVQDW